MLNMISILAFQKYSNATSFEFYDLSTNNFHLARNASTLVLASFYHNIGLYRSSKNILDIKLFELRRLWNHTPYKV